MKLFKKCVFKLIRRQYEDSVIDEQTKLNVQVNQESLKIVGELFAENNSPSFFSVCIEEGIIKGLIEQLGELTGEASRRLKANKEQQIDTSEKPQPKKTKKDKNLSEVDEESTIKKGVGYTTQIGEVWDVDAYIVKKEQKAQ